MSIARAQLESDDVYFAREQIAGWLMYISVKLAKCSTAEATCQVSYVSAV